MGTTPIHGLPYPDLSDAPNVPSDFSALASAVDTLLAQYSDAADVQVFTSSGTISRCPASILEISRMSLMRLSRSLPEASMVCAYLT